MAASAPAAVAPDLTLPGVSELYTAITADAQLLKCNICGRETQFKGRSSHYSYHQRRGELATLNQAPPVPRSTSELDASSISAPEIDNHSGDSKPFVHSLQQPVDQSLYSHYTQLPRPRLPPANRRGKWREIDTELDKVYAARLDPMMERGADITAAEDRRTEATYGLLNAMCGTHCRDNRRKARPAEPQHVRQLRADAKEAKRAARHVQSSTDGTSTGYARTVRQHNQVAQQHARSADAHEVLLTERDFRRDPHRYAERLFNPPSNKKPTFTRQAANEYFAATYADAERDVPYGAPPGMTRPPPPTVQFETAPPTLEQIRRVVMRRPNRSSPGPDGIPYVVYKRCPSALRRLHMVIERVWTTGVIPRGWQIAKIILLAKSEVLDSPKEFRPIALLNTGGKVFWAEYNRRHETYMRANHYVNVAVQKGFMSGMPGCLEHTAKLGEVLRVAKEQRRPICVAFLDLENAYGSVRHNLLQFAQHWYHVPEAMRRLVYHYYEHQVASVVTDEWQSDWFQLAMGTYQGCTGSTGLFTVAFNLLLDGLMQPQYMALGFRPAPGVAPVLAKAYADDVSTITSLPSENQRCIDRFVELLSWTRTMRLKPVKCRSLAFRLFDDRPSQYTPAQPGHRHSSFDPLLKVGDKAITFIGNDDVKVFKFLGMLVQPDLRDDVARGRLTALTERLLTLIDEQRLRSWMKVWLFNFYLASKLQWMLMIYDLPMTFVERLESTCTRYVKRWLGLARTAPVEVLYTSRQHHGWQMTAITTLFRRLQLTRLHLLKHSDDPDVQQLYERLRQRPRHGKLVWDPFDTLELREATVVNRLSENEQAAHRHGIGYGPAAKATPNTPAAVRKLIGKEVAATADTAQLARARTLALQGKWTNWRAVLPASISLRRLIVSSISDALIKFLINGQCRSLATDDNLVRWRKIPTGVRRCPLLRRDNVTSCGEFEPSLTHVLAGCNVALEQGRQLFRHNSVLLALKQHLVPHIHGINTGRVKLGRPGTFRFVRADGTWWNNGDPVAQLKAQTLRDYLCEASDWQLYFDLPGRDKFTYSIFPSELADTEKLPDILLMSEQLRLAVAFELTVPAEENVLFWNHEKLTKYTGELVPLAKERGWTLHIRPFEVGYLGHMARSMEKELRALGLSKQQRDLVKADVEEAALRCSFIIFHCRHQPKWVSRAPLPVGHRHIGATAGDTEH